jgi:hypothetical protein
MTDSSEPQPMPEGEHEPEKGLLTRHPKLQILLIAGVFYAILIGMCLATAALVWFM